jgi:hypothetical protein
MEVRYQEFSRLLGRLCDSSPKEMVSLVLRKVADPPAVPDEGLIFWGIVHRKNHPLFSRVPYPLRDHGYPSDISRSSSTCRSPTPDLGPFSPKPRQKEIRGASKYCRTVSYIQNPKYLADGIFETDDVLQIRRPVVTATSVAIGGDIQRIITNRQERTAT